MSIQTPFFLSAIHIIIILSVVKSTRQLRLAPSQPRCPPAKSLRHPLNQVQRHRHELQFLTSVGPIADAGETSFLICQIYDWQSLSTKSQSELSNQRSEAELLSPTGSKVTTEQKKSFTPTQKANLTCPFLRRTNCTIPP